MSSIEELPLTREEIERLKKLLQNPIFYPTIFKNWVSEKVRDEVTPQLPFSQILRSDVLKGAYASFPNKAAASIPHGTPGAWVNCGQLSVPGPVKAVIFFTAASYNWSGDNARVALSINGAAPDANQIMWLRGSNRRIFGSRAQYADFTAASNTVALYGSEWGSGDIDLTDLSMAVFRIFLTS